MGPPDLASCKVGLRGAMRRWRTALPAAEVKRRSVAITAQLCAWVPLQAAQAALVFESMAAEPETGALIAWLTARGTWLWVPAVSADTVGWRLLSGPGDPPAARASAPPPDLVLVPGLAFDRAGGRLGRGGGHYDRLLPGLRGGCLRVGVCFREQVVASVPREVWDQTVDWLATEDGLCATEAGRRDGGWRGGTLGWPG